MYNQNSWRYPTLKIENNIVKHYLENVYFITGTAYAGKTTTVKMLADRYGMLFCGENYHIAVSDAVATPIYSPIFAKISSLGRRKSMSAGFIAQVEKVWDLKLPILFQ